MAYRSRLPRISKQLAADIDSAMSDSAELVAAGAKLRVPIETGRLHKAIHVERKDQAEYMVVAGNREVFYGHIVEHGGRFQPAQPFLGPSLEANRVLIDERVRKALPE